jgi:hypothetical protein
MTHLGRYSLCWLPGCDIKDRNCMTMDVNWLYGEWWPQVASNPLSRTWRCLAHALALLACSRKANYAPCEAIHSNGGDCIMNTILCCMHIAHGPVQNSSHTIQHLTLHQVKNLSSGGRLSLGCAIESTSRVLTRWRGQSEQTLCYVPAHYFSFLIICLLSHHMPCYVISLTPS